MGTVFKEFSKNFNIFFEHCEKGFSNELIINMYCRKYEPDTTIVAYGDKFSELLFVSEGSVQVYNKFGAHSFMVLP